MSIYIITINNMNTKWVARVQAYLVYDNKSVLISDDNKSFLSKQNAFESLMLRFKDLNFEDDQVEVNLHAVHSRFEFVALLERELTAVY